MRSLLFVALLAGPASADDWLDVEAPAALAVSNAQQSLFSPGAMPAIGIYRSDGIAALGLRVRGGVLRNGPSPDITMKDPGLGGLATASVAIRIAGRAPWLELAAGVGITGDDRAPAFEAGVGYAFATKHFSIGPSARLVHVVAGSDARLGSADLVLFGVDLQLGREAPKPGRRAYVPPKVIAPPPPEPEPEVEIERDDEVILDGDIPCATDLSCLSDIEGLSTVGNRVVLEEQVLFAFDRARVRSRGRAVIRQLAAVMNQHPEWTKITVEGHTDARGSDEYNERLSQRRADNVRALLLRAGVPEANVTAIGLGRTHPRDDGDSEAAHERNRRVEFVIEEGSR